MCSFPSVSHIIIKSLFHMHHDPIFWLPWRFSCPVFNFQFPKKKKIDNLYFYFFNCLTKNLKRYWVQHCNVWLYKIDCVVKYEKGNGFFLPCLNSKVEESVDWSISSIIYNTFDLSFYFLFLLVVSFTELGDLQSSEVHHLLFIILLI